MRNADPDAKQRFGALIDAYVPTGRFPRAVDHRQRRVNH